MLTAHKYTFNTDIRWDVENKDKKLMKVDMKGGTIYFIMKETE
jgi:hypothetical protein